MIIDPEIDAAGIEDDFRLQYKPLGLDLHQQSKIESVMCFFDRNSKFFRSSGRNEYLIHAHIRSTCTELYSNVELRGGSRGNKQ